MRIPTTAELRPIKSKAAPITLSHSLALRDENVQSRLKGRHVITPEVDLSAYEFRTVIDWIEIELHLQRSTQIRHLHDLIDQHTERAGKRSAEAVRRNPTVTRLKAAPDDRIKPGDSFTSCRIRFQDPKSLAFITQIYQAIIQKYGEASSGQVVGLEVSFDAKPRGQDVKPSHESYVERMKLLGALQRTYFPTWDIWSRKFSWPRMTIGKAKKETIILVPDSQPKDGVPTTKKELLKQRLDMSYSAENYPDPALDSTVYLGQKGGDIMARIYDKTIDQQHHDGQHVVLEDIDHRARVEVSFRGEALKELGLTDIASLRHFRFARVNKLFFQFKLPVFASPSAKSTTHPAVQAYMERTRAEIYSRAGNIGLAFRNLESLRYRKETIKALRPRNSKSESVKLWTGTRYANLKPDPKKNALPTFVVWQELHKKSDDAFRKLDQREATAWRKLDRS